MELRRRGFVVALLSVIPFFEGSTILREGSSNAFADQPESDAALERKQRYSKWMHNYAQETKVELKPKAPVEGGEPKLAKLVPHPVLRYSDVEHRVPDATLWVWTHEGRPAAFQKVEGNNYGQQWTICFASLSEGLVDVKWPMDRSYSSHNPGVTYRPIPGAESPADDPRLRTAQIEALRDQFSARFGVKKDGTGGADAQVLREPLFEYEDPATKKPWGAIFGMSSTGTNPSALLIIEARPQADGKLQWHYALARMTTFSVRASLKDEEVWNEPEGNNQESGRWTYFFLRRDFE